MICALTYIWCRLTVTAPAQSCAAPGLFIWGWMPLRFCVIRLGTPFLPFSRFCCILEQMPMPGPHLSPLVDTDDYAIQQVGWAPPRGVNALTAQNGRVKQSNAQVLPGTEHGRARLAVWISDSRTLLGAFELGTSLGRFRANAFMNKTEQTMLQALVDRTGHGTHRLLNETVSVISVNNAFLCAGGNLCQIAAEVNRQSRATHPFALHSCDIRTGTRTSHS